METRQFGCFSIFICTTLIGFVYLWQCLTSQPVNTNQVGFSNQMQSILKNDLQFKHWINESIPICSSKQRLEYIRKQITKHNVTYPHATLLVNEKKRLAYCFIAKCSSSTIKRFMAYLNGNVDFTDLKRSIHNARTLRHFGLRLVNTKNWENAAEYRKFVVIRNPFSRLVSAFHDKVLHAKQHGWVGGRKDSNVTESLFAHFAERVVSGFSNLHFNSFARRCSFSDIDYDDVIRIESYRHDFEPVVRYTGSNMSVVLRVSAGHFRRNSTKAQDKIVDQTTVEPAHLADYTDVSARTLEKLKTMYKLDLELFGYDFDTATRTAICKLTDDNGNTCCWRTYAGDKFHDVTRNTNTHRHTALMIAVRNHVHLDMRAIEK